MFINSNGDLCGNRPMNIIEWCRKNDIWYLKIDLDIPKECIKEAQAVYDEGFFVDHRGGDGDGWASSALH